LKQKRQGYTKPTLPQYLASVKAIEATRATQLANDAKDLAFELLSIISKYNPDQIQNIFKSWWHTKGKEMLSMDSKSARANLAEDPPVLEEEFLEEHPLLRVRDGAWGIWLAWCVCVYT